MQADAKAMVEGRRMILACDAGHLPQQFQASGFYEADERTVLLILHAAGLWIGPREYLEQMPSHRQIIPYVVMRHGGKFLYYQRSKKGGEGRLHDRYSIGIGGHIDFMDIIPRNNTMDLGSTISFATEREVREELGGVVVQSRQVRGILVDNSDEVGRVHIGVVMEWELSEPPKTPKDPEIALIGLESAVHLLDGCGTQLENWSMMLLQQWVVPKYTFSKPGQASLI